MRIDTSNLGFKYFGHRERKDLAMQWLGCVEADGECGALGLNQLTGAYVLMRNASRPVELDPAAVLMALASPVRFNPPGRKPTAADARTCTVVLTEGVRADALAIGDGNLSLGLRRAVEAYRPDGR